MSRTWSLFSERRNGRNNLTGVRKWKWCPPWKIHGFGLFLFSWGWFPEALLNFTGSADINLTIKRIAKAGLRDLQESARNSPSFDIVFLKWRPCNKCLVESFSIYFDLHSAETHTTTNSLEATLLISRTWSWFSKSIKERANGWGKLTQQSDWDLKW